MTSASPHYHVCKQLSAWTQHLRAATTYAHHERSHVSGTETVISIDVFDFFYLLRPLWPVRGQQERITT